MMLVCKIIASMLMRVLTAGSLTPMEPMVTLLHKVHLLLLWYLNCFPCEQSLNTCLNERSLNACLNETDFVND